jgi:hypothetical protein
MRLRHQKYPYLYEIRSEVRFSRRRRRVVKGVHYEGNTSIVAYRTYYGSRVPLNQLQLLELAREKIKEKFLKSGGNIVGLQIANVYA